VVISASSAAKPWVREELDAAVVRRITGSVRLIPVRLDDAPIPAPLRGQLHGVSARAAAAVAQYLLPLAAGSRMTVPRSARAAPRDRSR
jgi:hypothetical protein